MKKYFFMAVAAIAVLSSCSNDNEFEPSQIGKQALTFTATMEGSEGTRATYNSINKCAEWEEGDQISINGVNYSAQTAGTTTTFKATTEGEEATGETYNAYFPASLYNNGTPTLPANVSETWAEGKFNMPMYASGSTTDLQFKNLCGVLKITVTPEQLPNVKCITVSSTNCATSGAFTVSGDAAVLVDASNTAKTVTVTYTKAVTTDATGKVFYVAIPAQTYKNLSIAVSDGTTTKVMTTKKDQDIEVARKTVYPITFNGQPTKGTAERTGGNVNWVQLWAGGPKFAEYNVGATSVTDYGGYYAWGGKTDKGTDYNNDDKDLSGTYDTATNLWGSNWRMPTSEELGKKDADGNYIDGLLGKCTCSFKTSYNGTGVNGLLCTGNGAYASNSVFLPAAGFYFSGGVSSQGYYGDYWSSTPGVNNDACLLGFSSGDQDVNYSRRGNGNSVRAVLAEQD